MQWADESAPARAPEATTANASPRELKVSGHLLSLPAGLFCMLHEPAEETTGGLPAIRVSLPPCGADGVEITGFRQDGWLGAGGDAALIRVAAGPAQILVTIYRAPDAAGSAPKLQLRRLLASGESPATAFPGQPPATAPGTGSGTGTGQKFDFLAHRQGSGDVGGRFGGWIGAPGDGNWIEGFAIAPLPGFATADLSYQAVLGRGWLSPWVEAGQYCGSRGMALPLLGFRIRLQGDAAEAFELAASASFLDGSRIGPVGSDETCEGEKLAPLEAMTLSLVPRQPARERR